MPPWRRCSRLPDVLVSLAEGPPGRADLARRRAITLQAGSHKGGPGTRSGPLLAVTAGQAARNGLCRPPGHWGCHMTRRTCWTGTALLEERTAHRSCAARHRTADHDIAAASTREYLLLISPSAHLNARAPIVEVGLFAPPVVMELP